MAYESKLFFPHETHNLIHNKNMLANRYALVKCIFEVEMELTRWKQQWLAYEFMDGLIY